MVAQLGPGVASLLSLFVSIVPQTHNSHLSQMGSIPLLPTHTHNTHTQVIVAQRSCNRCCLGYECRSFLAREGASALREKGEEEGRGEEEGWEGQKWWAGPLSGKAILEQIKGTRQQLVK